MLDTPFTTQLARIALGHVEVEYPNHIMHVMHNETDAATPRQLHPVFFGSFDWHSCVHAYWLLARLYNRWLPRESETARDIEALFERRLTAAAIAQEVAYFDGKGRSTFERPYGWAWLLKLALELHSAGSDAGQWAAQQLQPLEHRIAELWLAYWPKQPYPIRTGTHANSAFATLLGLEYARGRGNTELEQQLERRACDWFQHDAASPAWEPGGDEFLSSTLIEALCMQRVLPDQEFRTWFDGFLPTLAERQPSSLFTPATVTDRSDGKIAHLDGLNLSRGWCFSELAKGLPSGDVRTQILQQGADEHLKQAIDHLDDDYMGSHWLASFALLALESSQK